MSASDFAGLPFALRVHELGKGWRVTVDAGEDRMGEIAALDLETALRMAVPFIVAIAKPDRFAEGLERRLRLPSAPDGPRDMGGLDAA